MAQAFYRKYRSKSLSEVIGQEHITDTLGRAIKAGKISHAYLFTGPRGVGKTSVARILAHEINNLAYTEESNHLDIIEIDAASNRRIDDVRDLRDKVNIAPTSAKYKVYIIDEVHMLTGESFNALLKTLEEPPAHVVFILATTEIHKLPATIVSRTQRYQFKPINKVSAAKHLANIAKKEKIDIEPSALELLADHGDGSFRDSISLLDQLSGAPKKITTADVEHMLGLAPKGLIDDIMQALLGGESAELQKLLHDYLNERGSNPQTLAKQLLEKLGAEASENPDLFPLMSALLEISKSSDPRLKLVINLLQFSTAHSHHNSKPVLVAPSSSKPVVSAPAPVQKTKVETKKTTEKPKTDKAILKTFSEDCWDEVMEFVRNDSPALFSIISKAAIKLKNNELTLIFSFKLYQAKLEDSRYRQQLLLAIESCGFDCPQILAIVDKNVPKPSYTSKSQNSEQPANETTASVLAMMGGGEIVNAKI